MQKTNRHGYNEAEQREPRFVPPFTTHDTWHLNYAGFIYAHLSQDRLRGFGRIVLCVEAERAVVCCGRKEEGVCVMCVVFGRIEEWVGRLDECGVRL